MPYKATTTVGDSTIELHEAHVDVVERVIALRVDGTYWFDVSLMVNYEPRFVASESDLLLWGGVRLYVINVPAHRAVRSTSGTMKCAK